MRKHSRKSLVNQPNRNGSHFSRQGRSEGSALTGRFTLFPGQTDRQADNELHGVILVRKADQLGNGATAALDRLERRCQQPCWIGTRDPDAD